MLYEAYGSSSFSWFSLFFFKQKTAYEMRISDWSSDVCSSYLRLARLSDRHDPQAALLCFAFGGRRPWIVVPDHRGAARIDHLAKQPHLRRQISIHVAMIVEMIVAEVGKGGGRHRRPFGAILVEAMARRLERRVGHAFGGEARHVAEEGHDVGRGEPGRRAVVRGRDAERAERGGMKARHAPELARHFDRRGLAVGARHRDAGCREPVEEASGDASKGTARVGIGDMDRALRSEE